MLKKTVTYKLMGFQMQTVTILLFMKGLRLVILHILMETSWHKKKMRKRCLVVQSNDRANYLEMVYASSGLLWLKYLPIGREIPLEANEIQALIHIANKVLYSDRTQNIKMDRRLFVDISKTK